MRRSIFLVLAFAACSGSSATDVPTSASAPAAPASSTEATTSTAAAAIEGRLPEGFDRIQARVTEPDGTVCEVCLWLANDGAQRARGLMFATDLGPADGMAFRYPQPRTGNFWMKNTLLPLSIAFYDAAGTYLDAFDMEPCETDPCPRYRTPHEFLVAVEVLQGGLTDLGMVPGSTLELLDLPCT